MVVDVTENKHILIGEIDFSGCNIIDEVSQIESEKNKKPNLTGLGTCSVYINSYEGTVPHVHVVNTDGFGTYISVFIMLFISHMDMILLPKVYSIQSNVRNLING